MQNQVVSKAFLSWQSFREESRRIKTVAFRVLGRVGNALLAAGFFKWFEVFQIQIAAENKAQHDRMVMEKFLKRIQLSSCAKCVVQWVEYKSQRKFLRLFISRMIGGSYLAFLQDGLNHWVGQINRERAAHAERENKSWKAGLSSNIGEVSEAKRASLDEDETRATNPAKLMATDLILCMATSTSELTLFHSICLRLFRKNECTSLRSVQLQKELQMHSQLLLDAKAVIDRKDEAIGILKRQIAGYCEQNNNKVVSRAFETWTKHWAIKQRQAWNVWRQKISFLQKIQKSRNVMRLIMVNTIHYNLGKAMRKWKGLCVERGVEEKARKLERQVKRDKARETIQMLERNAKNFSLDLSDEEDDDEEEEEEE